VEYKQQLERSLRVAVPIVPVQIVRRGNAARLRAERFDWCAHIPRGVCYGVNVPMVDKNGFVYACCEPPLDLEIAPNPLMLGNLHQEPLTTILACARSNVYVQALRVLGPGYLAQLAIQQGFRHTFKAAYPRDSICEVCYDLLQDAGLVARVCAVLEQPKVRQQIAARQSLFHGDDGLSQSSLPL
jgi:hypothetical protein